MGARCCQKDGVHGTLTKERLELADVPAYTETIVLGATVRPSRATTLLPRSNPLRRGVFETAVKLDQEIKVLTKDAPHIASITATIANASKLIDDAVKETTLQDALSTHVIDPNDVPIGVEHIIGASGAIIEDTNNVPEGDYLVQLRYKFTVRAKAAPCADTIITTIASDSQWADSSSNKKACEDVLKEEGIDPADASSMTIATPSGTRSSGSARRRCSVTRTLGWLKVSGQRGSIPRSASSWRRRSMVASAARSAAVHGPS